MAQPPLHLIIGNYNTSSWSLRAWLVLRLARLAFVETRIPLRLAETPEQIGRYSPSGRLPVLLAESVPIWDSLAIAEFIAELEPGIWPLDPIARAEARSISAEVHSGFAELRRLMPMDIVGRFNAPGRLPRGLAADIHRVMTIFEHCRARFAPQGPFLFGAFSITDAMMAPVATRLLTHGVPLAGAVEDYVDSLMAWPDMVTWCDAAAAEQAEREVTGGLAVASVTRPGRVLGPAPAASEEVLSAAIDAVPGEAQAETVAETAARAAETAAAEAEPVAPEADKPVPAPAAFATSADDRPGEAAADAPPRRRLFEAAPPGTSEAPAASPATGAAAAAAPTVSEAPELPPARKLGWLRHGVPADHFDAAVRPVGDGETSPEAAPQEEVDRQETAARPPVPPLVPEARPSPPRAPEPPRQPAPGARPNAPAIKPIGGGILRRR